jgi:hypothetical protein
MSELIATSSGEIRTRNALLGYWWYIKSEADNYIKELKEQNHELCQALHSMYSEEEMNYQKYKRCLAMALLCFTKGKEKQSVYKLRTFFWNRWGNKWQKQGKIPTLYIKDAI